MPVSREIGLDTRQAPVKQITEPLCRQAAAFGLLQSLVHAPRAHQPESVPYLVPEIASLLAHRLVEHDVVTRRGTEQHGHPHPVGAVTVYQVERVGELPSDLLILRPSLSRTSPVK